MSLSKKQSQAYRGAAGGSTTATTPVPTQAQPLHPTKLFEASPVQDFLPYIGAAPQTTPALGNDTKYIKISMPKGTRMSGLLLELTVVTAGSVGAGTAKTSKQIKEIKIHDGNEQGEVIGYAIGDALDAASLFGAAKFKGYTSGGKGSGTSDNIPLDVVIAANSSYFAVWLLPLVTRCMTGSITVEVTTNGTATLTGFSTAPTTLTQTTFAAVLTRGEISEGTGDNAEMEPDYYFEGIVSYNALKVALDNVKDVMFAMSNQEFTAIITGSLVAGADSYSPPQVALIEDLTNAYLAGSWTTNLQSYGTTSGTQFFAPTSDPQLAANTPLFAIILSPHGHTEFSVTTGKNIIIVALHPVKRARDEVHASDDHQVQIFG